MTILVTVIARIVPTGVAVGSDVSAVAALSE